MPISATVALATARGASTTRIAGVATLALTASTTCLRLIAALSAARSLAALAAGRGLAAGAAPSTALGAAERTFEGIAAAFQLARCALALTGRGGIIAELFQGIARGGSVSGLGVCGTLLWLAALACLALIAIGCSTGHGAGGGVLE
ncbi:MAG: hypothetical protein ACR2IK_13310, partial [Chloroflexota bacterium]